MSRKEINIKVAAALLLCVISIGIQYAVTHSMQCAPGSSGLGPAILVMLAIGLDAVWVQIIISQWNTVLLEEFEEAIGRKP